MSLSPVLRAFVLWLPPGRSHESMSTVAGRGWLKVVSGQPGGGRAEWLQIAQEQMNGKEVAS